jgi:hypothetical protein
VRELVEHASGVTVDGFEVTFGGDYLFEFEELVPGGVPIAADGFGNYWVVDIEEDGSWKQVLFICHDPPAAVIQARDLASFLDQVIEGDAAEIAERLIRNVWKQDSCLISIDQAIASQDEVLRAFAERLDETFSVVDLRAGEVVTGLGWGRAGSPAVIRRNGRLLMFGVKKKKPGFLRRLLSRV